MLLEKTYRIKKNADFQRIYKKGHSIANGQFTVYACNNKKVDHFHLGISVSKKLGNTVLRNKIKRAIHENFKVHKSHILAKDIIIIARQPAKDMTILQIRNNLEHVLEIIKAFNKRVK